MAETTTSAHRHPGAGPVAEEHLPGFARRRPFALVLLVTGVIGWVASAILVLERLQLYKDPGHVTSCDINPWVSCGQVMGTWQSELFGFPNPLIGIVAFAVVITTAMAALAGAQFGRWYWIRPRHHPRPAPVGAVCLRVGLDSGGHRLRGRGGLGVLPLLFYLHRSLTSP